MKRLVVVLAVLCCVAARAFAAGEETRLVYSSQGLGEIDPCG